MLFSSWEFIVLFLPIAFIVYFFFNHRRMIVAGKSWLVLVSLFFYAYWDFRYLPLMLGSIFFNYLIGTRLARSSEKDYIDFLGLRTKRRFVLFFGIASNVAFLGYYKYTDFLILNFNLFFGSQFNTYGIALPLAISFFTFTQIVYLVDSYRGETARYDLLNYALFVTFFPHLIAGPIVHHHDIMPQFFSRWTWAIRYKNIMRGIFIFSVGLFKKVVIADTFSVWANAGFDGGIDLTFFSAWVTSLSYTFQLYFDFSGYCDMAIGCSLLFNIALPINFNSPYQATDIQDFWRRWHITLSSFLRDYIYIPLGGNRGPEWRTCINLLATFLLGGLWHGASWMFVIWGALHGMALVIHRFWKKLERPLPVWTAWLLTFLFVNFSWVFFRAKTMDDAWRVLRGMADFRSVWGQPLISSIPTSDLAWGGWLSDIIFKITPLNIIGQIPYYLAIIFTFFIIFRKNSIEIASGAIGRSTPLIAASLFLVSMHFILSATSSVFLYFNF